VLAACAAAGFLLLQWRTSLIREQESDWRTFALELQTQEAKRDTAAAQEHIAELNKKTARLGAETESARAAIATANARAAEANRLAEQERLARVQLEARLAARVVSADNQNRISQELEQFSGTVAYMYLSVWNCRYHTACALAAYNPAERALGRWRRSLDCAWPCICERSAR